MLLLRGKGPLLSHLGLKLNILFKNNFIIASLRHNPHYWIYLTEAALNGKN